MHQRQRDEHQRTDGVIVHGRANGPSAEFDRKPFVGGVTARILLLAGTLGLG